MPIDLPENVVPSSSISIASFKFLPSLPTFGSKKGKDFMSPSLEKFGIKTILGSNQSDVIKKVIILFTYAFKKFTYTISPCFFIWTMIGIAVIK